MSVLTEEEIRFFKREGYLIKKGVLDPKLCARARNRLWDDPPPSLNKDDRTDNDTEHAQPFRHGVW